MQSQFENEMIVHDEVPEERAASIKEFVDRVRSHYISTELIRVGPNWDGGYLVPDMLDQVEYCFSPGVSRTSKFEAQLARDYGIKSFLADASVDGPGEENPDFDFEKRFLGSRTDGIYMTLSDWMARKLPASGEAILQMDIEGAEYEVLTYEPAETLSRFAVILVEFHTWRQFRNGFFDRVISAIFAKLFENFKIAHIHPNNVGKLIQLGDVVLPQMPEFTFLRNDFCERLSAGGKLSFPHPLDRPNVSHLEDVTLPENWFG
ncbi:MAG: FkbM family methyltransferase [Pseudomonadota bacterium]